ncbi:hypothetical protein V8C86DRAFT_1367203 [Haematococcus lacustris]
MLLRNRSIASRIRAQSAGRPTPCLRVPLSSFNPLQTPRHICRSQQQGADVDIDAQVEAFMKRQAEMESGAAFARTIDPDKIIGADVVDEETAKSYCREIFEVLRSLRTTRDMSVAEVKLVVSIEDPRTKERRLQGIEDTQGVSRDEMAAALLEVAEGRVPKDRIALKCLYEEIASWPFLEKPMNDVGTSSGSSSRSASRTEAPVPQPALTELDFKSLRNADTVVKPYIMSDSLRKGDKPQGLADMLPDWVGYVTLYGISSIPVLLVVGTVLILFYNSLK